MEPSPRGKFMVEVGEDHLGGGLKGPMREGKGVPSRGNSMSKGSEVCWEMCLHVSWGEVSKYPAGVRSGSWAGGVLQRPRP